MVNTISKVISNLNDSHFFFFLFFKFTIFRNLVTSEPQFFFSHLLIKKKKCVYTKNVNALIVCLIKGNNSLKWALYEMKRNSSFLFLFSSISIYLYAFCVLTIWKGSSLSAIHVHIYLYLHHPFWDYWLVWRKNYTMHKKINEFNDWLKG